MEAIANGKRREWRMGRKEAGNDWKDELAAEQQRMPKVCGIPAVGGASSSSNGKPRGGAAITRFVSQAKGLGGAMERAKRQKELASGGGSSANLLSSPSANASAAGASAAEIARPGRAWDAYRKRAKDAMRRLKEGTKDDDGAELLRASPGGRSAERKAKVSFLMMESPAIERIGKRGEVEKFFERRIGMVALKRSKASKKADGRKADGLPEHWCSLGLGQRGKESDMNGYEAKEGVGISKEKLREKNKPEEDYKQVQASGFRKVTGNGTTKPLTRKRKKQNQIQQIGRDVVPLAEHAQAILD